MPDITMCFTTGCPLAKTCGRSPESGTKPNPHWQSCASFTWRLDGEPQCDWYMILEGRA